MNNPFYRRVPQADAYTRQEKLTLLGLIAVCLLAFPLIALILEMIARSSGCK